MGRVMDIAIPALEEIKRPEPASGSRDIVIDRIGKSFAESHVLSEVSFELRDGEFLTLLGPSGSGKSTTLGIIAGFVEPSSGDVRVGDRSLLALPARQRDLGIVFQNYALFPHLTVLENVEFGLRMRNVPARERRNRAASMLSRLGLDGFGDRRPAQLSGGQQQRVALARAPIIDPVALLLDEPLGALDRRLREHVQIELKSIQQQTRVSVLYVTHDQEEAMVMSDRLAVMQQGAIVQIDTPSVVYRFPRTRFVAEFLGEANLVEVVVESAGPSHAGVVYPDGSRSLIHRSENHSIAAGDRALVCIRPERIRVVEASARVENLVSGTITSSIYLGPAVRYSVRCFGKDLVVTTPDRGSGQPLASGSEVRLGWAREDGHLIPEERDGG